MFNFPQAVGVMDICGRTFQYTNGAVMNAYSYNLLWVTTSEIMQSILPNLYCLEYMQ